MATLCSETEIQNFHRVVALLIDEGSGVLRKLLMKYVQPLSLGQYLLNNKVILDNLQTTKRILNQSQMDIMFPKTGSADIGKFDITLLSCLLKNICGKLPYAEKQAIESLRKYRNEIAGHTAKAAIEENDFNTLWGKVSQVIQSISHCCGDVNFATEVRDVINDLKTNPKLRPSTYLIELMYQWYQSDKEVIQELDAAKEEIKKDIASVKSELKRAENTLSGQAQKRHEQVMTGMVTLQNDIDSTKKAVEAMTDATKTASTPSDPALVKLRKSSKQFLLANGRDRYIQTKLMDQVVERIQSSGCCVISGKPGEGKTMTAANIMKSQFDIDKCLVLSHPRDWTTVDIDETEALLIDDIFGVYKLDEGIATEWMRLLDKIAACTGTSQKGIKVVITTRVNILAQCNRSTLKQLLFFQNIVELSSDKLLKNEKKEMLLLALELNKQTLQDPEINDCVEGFTSPIGFPICCNLFCSSPSLFGLRELFFEKPYTFVKRNLSTLDHETFSSLVFLFYLGGSVLKSKLQDNEKKSCTLLQEISKALDISPTLLPSVIKKRLKQLLGIYITESDSFSFIHNTVYETVGILYGKTNPIDVVRMSSSDFLHQCIYVCHGNNAEIPYGVKEIDDDDQCEQTLNIQSLHFTVLADRLIKEVISRREVVRVASHPVLQNKTYLHFFVSFLMSKKVKKQFFTTIDIQGITFSGKYFLAHYMHHLRRRAGAEKEVSVFVNCFRKCNHKFSFVRKGCWMCMVMEDAINHCLICSLEIGWQYDTLLPLLMNHGALPGIWTLFYAVNIPNTGLVRKALKRRAVPCVQDANLAVLKGEFAICTVFAKHGAVPDNATVNRVVLASPIGTVRSVLALKPKLTAETINCAIKREDIALLNLLLEHGAKSDDNSLQLAIRLENFKLARMLCTSGRVSIQSLTSKKKCSSPDDKTLFNAVFTRDVDRVRDIIDLGTSPNPETVDIALLQGDIGLYKELVTNSSASTAIVNRIILSEDVDYVKEVLKLKLALTRKTLNCAIRRDDTGLVTAVLEKGVLPDTSSLQNAVWQGNREVVRQVLLSGARPSREILRCAVEEGRIDIAGDLVQNGATADAKILVMFAAQGGDMSIIRSAVNQRDGIMKEVSKLHNMQSVFDTIQYLMDFVVEPDSSVVKCALQGGDINILRLIMKKTSVPDREILKNSIQGAHADAVRALIEHGAAPDKTSIDEAIQRDDTEIVKILLETIDKPHSESLFHAVKGGNVSIVRTLLEHGAVPDTEAVNCAIRKGSIEIVRVLTDLVGSGDEKNVKLAIEEGKVDILNLLLEHSPVPSKEIMDNAIEKGCIGIAKVLIEHGAVFDEHTLNCAVDGGHTDLVYTLLENDAVPDTELLNRALKGNNDDVIQAILKFDAIPDTESLNLSLKKGNTDLVRTIIKAGALPDTTSMKLSTDLGDVSIISQMISKGAVPDSESLNWAVARKHEDLYNEMIKYGAIPNSLTLRHLVRECKIKSVSEMLAKGVVPDTKAVTAAIQGGDMEMVKILLEHGANPDMETLNAAVYKGNIDCISVLIELGLMPDTDTLNCAVRGSSSDVVRYIIEKGSRADSETLYWAVLRGEVDICNLVMDYGGLPDSELLHLSVLSGNDEVVKAVLERGVRAERVDLSCAILKGKEDTVKALLAHGAKPDANLISFANQRGNPEIKNAVQSGDVT